MSCPQCHWRADNSTFKLCPKCHLCLENDRKLTCHLCRGVFTPARAGDDECPACESLARARVVEYPTAIVHLSCAKSYECQLVCVIDGKSFTCAVPANCARIQMTCPGVGGDVSWHDSLWRLQPVRGCCHVYRPAVVRRGSTVGTVDINLEEFD